MPWHFRDLFCERKTIKNSKKSSKSDKIFDKMTTEQLIKKLMEDNEKILAEQKRMKELDFELFCFLTFCFVIFVTVIWLKY